MIRTAVGLAISLYALSMAALLLSGRAPLGQIAFASQDEGNSDIFLYDLDTLQLENLTHSPEADYDPVWSPDGREIVFTSYRNGNAELYVAPVDCRLSDCDAGAARLTLAIGLDILPEWQPDGARLAFVSDRDGDQEIYLLDLACVSRPAGCANSVRNLTRNSTHDASPVWSPDGQRIAFESLRDGNPEIYSMDADGGSARRLTQHPASDRSPLWSPDGQHIAFLSERDGNTEIYLMEADGSSVQRLTYDRLLDRGFVWSPDSREIAYTSQHEGPAHIRLLDVQRGITVRLIHPFTFSEAPAWRP